ncbi:MAG: Holliday junction resolvase RuvX [Deltaproteobacteria bacterium]|nr:Holliday junction resolvase RuvX [Deltaproteobacteria bacterium]
MRWLGLDLGSRTIGIAVSDELGWTAQPLLTWRRVAGRPEQDLEQLGRVARSYGVGGILVGLPLEPSGEVGRQAREVLAFVERLRAALGLPVETWDERLSTKAVERVLIEADLSRRRRRQVVDKLAAAYILQGYLDAGCPRSGGEQGDGAR